MVTLGIDLGVGEAGAGRDNAGECAFDEFAGLRGFDLIADGNFHPTVEEFLDIAVGGVVGDAGHGHAVTMCQGDAEELGTPLGVLQENFVEVTESEHEQGIVRELATDFVPLLHHGSEFLFGRHKSDS